MSEKSAAEILDEILAAEEAEWGEREAARVDDDLARRALAAWLAAEGDDERRIRAALAAVLGDYGNKARAWARREPAEELRSFANAVVVWSDDPESTPADLDDIVAQARAAAERWSPGRPSQVSSRRQKGSE